MTIKNFEIPEDARDALVLVRDGKPVYIDLSDPMMSAIFAPAVAAVEAGERELRGNVAGKAQS